MPRTECNALRDPHIPPDVETQIRLNVAHHALCGIRTRPT
jgi:hypothetical protein